MSSQEAKEIGNSLSTSIAEALGPSFRQTRAAADLARLEPDSSDLVLFLRARNAKYPTPWSDISRSGARFLLVAILAEAYNIFALDVPTRRNDVVLPFSAVVLSLYELFYNTRYESTRGNYSIEYQLFVLKADGTLISRRQFTDSARVRVQADARRADMHIQDFVKARQDDVSGSIQDYIIADSTRLDEIGEEMKRSYPVESERILTFKRNIYHVLDDTTTQITASAGKNRQN